MRLFQIPVQGRGEPTAAQRPRQTSLQRLQRPDEAAAQAAEEQFDLVFKQHAVPDDIPEFAADLTPNDDGTVYLAKLLADASLAASAGEARRLIDGGGVKVNGEALPAKSYNVDPALLAGATLQVGKRKFVKLV